MKSSRSARVAYWLQAAFYAIILSTLLGEAGIPFANIRPLSEEDARRSTYFPLDGLLVSVREKPLNL